MQILAQRFQAWRDGDRTRLMQVAAVRIMKQVRCASERAARAGAAY